MLTALLPDMTITQAVKKEIAEMSKFQGELSEQIALAEAQKERLSHLINALNRVELPPEEEQLELDLGDKSSAPT